MIDAAFSWLGRMLVLQVILIIDTRDISKPLRKIVIVIEESIGGNGMKHICPWYSFVRLL
jgi:hypothetical protein